MDLSRKKLAHVASQRVGLSYCRDQAQPPKLAHRPAQALLDPAFAQAQSVQNPGIGEVPDHHPAQRRLAVVLVGPFGPHRSDVLSDRIGRILDEQRVKDLGLNAFGPPLQAGEKTQK